MTTQVAEKQARELAPIWEGSEPSEGAGAIPKWIAVNLATEALCRHVWTRFDDAIAECDRVIDQALEGNLQARAASARKEFLELDCRNEMVGFLLRLAPHLPPVMPD